MKRTSFWRRRKDSIKPLMPSPGIPNTVSTPQLINVSTRTSPAVIVLMEEPFGTRARPAAPRLRFNPPAKPVFHCERFAADPHRRRSASRAASVARREKSSDQIKGQRAGSDDSQPGPAAGQNHGARFGLGAETA